MSVNTCKFFSHSFTGKIINIYIEHFHWNNEIWKTVCQSGFSPEWVLICSHMVSLLNVFSCVSLRFQLVKRILNTLYKQMVSLQNGFLCVTLNHWLLKNILNIACWFFSKMNLYVFLQTFRSSKQLWTRLTSKFSYDFW